VDIENAFYTSLTENLNSRRKNWEDQLKLLLKAMQSMIELLAEYLQSQEMNKEIQEIQEIYEILNQPIIAHDVAVGTMKNDEFPTITMIVNFNYTSTIEYYLNREKQFTSKMQVNFIHGKLNEDKNPIIFGYGDEADRNYKIMEEWMSYGYFKYIKTFWYPKASNYFKLMRFVESEPFQVFNLGHSYGLSDRTMLNTIFGHPNCRSIKTFYHEQEGTNNFDRLIENISLIFQDGKAMRQKVVPFTQCSPMPQLMM
jgi:hypothetical protein